MKVSEYVGGYIRNKPDCVARANLDGRYSTVSLSDHYLEPQCPNGLGGMIYEARPDRLSESVTDLYLRVECLLADRSKLDNRVYLANELDSFGLPRVVMDYRIDPLDQSRLDIMVTKCTKILKASGCVKTRREYSRFQNGSTHLHGTCRFGDDDRLSVADRFGRVHSSDNVYLIDGAVFPYPGSVNPTLTIQANALRIARQFSRPGKSHAS